MKPEQENRVNPDTQELPFSYVNETLAEDRRLTALETGQEEPIHATIGSHENRGSYVWVNTPDGEALAKSLEDLGIPVTRVLYTPAPSLNGRTRLRLKRDNESVHIVNKKKHCERN